MDQPGQTVFVADGEIHAQQVRAFLEAAGISTTVRGESLRHTHGLTVDGLGAVQIVVADEFRLPDDVSESDGTDR
jgi:hypothetical protein